MDSEAGRKAPKTSVIQLLAAALAPTALIERDTYRIHRDMLNQGVKPTVSRHSHTRAATASSTFLVQRSLTSPMSSTSFGSNRKTLGVPDSCSACASSGLGPTTST
mgnify:CR=1 FL=1